MGLLDHEPGISHTYFQAVTDTIGLVVFVATQARQDELDAKYGPGVVTLVGWFVPID